jgi:hypothetical protein
MGLKDITDKASWIEAKAVIDSRLRRAPFWLSRTSKALITMPENMVASAVSLYPSLPHSYSHTSLEIIDFASTTSQSFPIANHVRMAIDPKGVTTISLPKHVMALLNNLPAHSIKTFSQAR